MMNTRRSVVSIILFFSAFIMIVSCEKQRPEWKGKIETVDGISVVHNFQDDVFKSIEFVVDLSIGVDEGNEDYMFSYPVDIDSDSKGNIYILDFKETTIKKYDDKGIFIKYIGREGQGPGEFESPYGFCISNKDFIYIADFMSRKIEAFNCEGEYQKSINAKDAIEQILIDNNEDLILNYHSVKEEGKSTRRISKIGIYDSQEDRIFDFFAKEKTLFRRIQSREFTIILPYERFNNDSKGNIYVGTVNNYEISVYSPKGKLLFKFSKDYKPIPRDQEIKKKAIKQLSGRGLPIDISEYEKLIEYYPIFDSISCDEKNRIWVGLYQPPKEYQTIESSYFDVFSSEGKYIFTTKIDKNIQGQLVFKNGFIYALIKNEPGFSRALRLKISKNY